jgi:hypothetical protein
MARSGANRLLAAFFERAPEDRKCGPILVTACFDLCANQRLQPEDADGDLAQRPRDAVGDQVLIAAPEADIAEYIERSTAREQQMVPFAFEGVRFGTKNASGQVAIACVERSCTMSRSKVEIGAPPSTAATPPTTTKSTRW